jgi:hypothetical protein
MLNRSSTPSCQPSRVGRRGAFTATSPKPDVSHASGRLPVCLASERYVVMRQHRGYFRRIGVLVIMRSILAQFGMSESCIAMDKSQHRSRIGDESQADVIEQRMSKASSTLSHSR